MLCFRKLQRQLFNAKTFNTTLEAITLNTNQVATTATTTTKHKPLDDVQIVVIGAGLAGLSAANHLIKNGFKRTIVLEATDRCGGRVNSKQFGDAFCELGAKWITIDGKQNSVYELLRQATGLQKKIKQNGEVMYLNMDGHRINKKVTDRIHEIFRNLSQGVGLKAKFRSGDLHDLNSVHTYFEAETNKLVQSMFSKKEQTVAKDVFKVLIKEFSSLLGCCLEYVNIQHITNLQQRTTCPMYIPTGLDNILYQITNNIDQHQMQVGKPVGEIKWYGNTCFDKTSVGCLDGSFFGADHIICTLPLGVLKTFSKYIFKPHLPFAKTNAINNIGFGSPVKMYFEYGRHISPWFTSNIRPLWNAEEGRTVFDWTKQIVEISKVPKSSRVLEILVGGAYYDEIEKLSDVEVISEVTTLLRTCLKNQKIPYPKSLLRSNWSTSATFLGGRPYFATSSTVNDVNTLAEPLGDETNLLFAGDATILSGFGTIDGARQSGIREAERIVEYYKRLA